MFRLNSTPLVGKVAIDFRKFVARLKCVGENKSFAPLGLVGFPFLPTPCEAAEKCHLQLHDRAPAAKAESISIELRYA
jgi:hypothetical protein